MDSEPQEFKTPDKRSRTWSEKVDADLRSIREPEPITGRRNTRISRPNRVRPGEAACPPLKEDSASDSEESQSKAATVAGGEAANDLTEVEVIGDFPACNNGSMITPKRAFLDRLPTVLSQFRSSPPANSSTGKVVKVVITLIMINGVIGLINGTEGSYFSKDLFKDIPNNAFGFTHGLGPAIFVNSGSINSLISKAGLNFNLVSESFFKIIDPKASWFLCPHRTGTDEEFDEAEAKLADFERQLRTKLKGVTVPNGPGGRMVNLEIELKHKVIINT